jgi:hypothetical protein
VYVDLEEKSLSTPAARDAQLSALNDDPSLEPAQVDIERVRQLLRAQPGLTRSARALAIFSCVQAGLLEVIRLPREVEPSWCSTRWPGSSARCADVLARGGWNDRGMSSPSLNLGGITDADLGTRVTRTAERRLATVSVGFLQPVRDRHDDRGRLAA